ncbi:MAG: hypothetical protein NTY45_10280 [Elusimicrobia bacterium]|nr:hypothetical protein [Elusimicrobiota bacterium]
MATIFSNVLTQLRKDSGFPTAYGFYHANGGAPVLLVSYRNYLQMEQGKIFPVIDRLRRLSFALRLTPQSPQIHSLVIAWLKTMAGEDNYRDALEPIILPKAEIKRPSPAHEALKKSLADNKYFMTPAQLAAVVASFDTYLCYIAMSSETGTCTVEDLAKSLDLKKPAAVKAIKILAAAKIIKEVKKDVYKCPLSAYSSVEMPYLSLKTAEVHNKLEACLKQLEASGQKEWSTTLTVRADAPVFKCYFPMLQMGVHSSKSYEIPHKTAKSAIYYVKGRITKLRDF